VLSNDGFRRCDRLLAGGESGYGFVCSFYGKPFEHIGQAFGIQYPVRIRDVKMQMRPEWAASRIANTADYLSGGNTIPGFHRQAARLQMLVYGKSAIANVEYDVIAAVFVQ
jgi:hypothetical protein